MTTGFLAVEGVGDQVTGRLDATDHLDDQVDVGVGDHGGGVVGQQLLVELHVPIERHVAHRHAADIEAQTGPGGDGFTLFVDQLDQRGAHVAAAEQADADVGHRPAAHSGHRCTVPAHSPRSCTEIANLRASEVRERL